METVGGGARDRKRNRDATSIGVGVPHVEACVCVYISS